MWACWKGASCRHLGISLSESQLFSDWFGQSIHFRLWGKAYFQTLGTGAKHNFRFWGKADFQMLRLSIIWGRAMRAYIQTLGRSLPSGSIGGVSFRFATQWRSVSFLNATGLWIQYCCWCTLCKYVCVCVRTRVCLFISTPWLKGFGQILGVLCGETSSGA